MAIKRVWQHTDEAMRADALAQLASWYPRGTTVTGVYMAGNRTGDGHTIKILATGARGEILNASYAACRVIGWLYDDARGGIRVNGGNMNMLAHIVYTIARELYGDGYALDYRQV